MTDRRHEHDDDLLSELPAAERERLAPVVARLEALAPAAWEDPGTLPPLLLPDEPAPAPAPAGAPARAPDRRPWWRRSLALRPLPAAAFASVLLALGVGAGVLAAGGGDDEIAGRVVALAPVEPLGGTAEGTATFAASEGRASVRLSGLEPTGEGEFYELWLLNSPDDLVALGSFAVPASGEVDMTVPLPADPSGFAAIDVSVEPADGDPGHSSRSVLRAPLAPS